MLCCENFIPVSCEELGAGFAEWHGQVAIKDAALIWLTGIDSRDNCGGSEPERLFEAGVEFVKNDLLALEADLVGAQGGDFDAQGDEFHLAGAEGDQLLVERGEQGALFAEQAGGIRGG